MCEWPLSKNFSQLTLYWGSIEEDLPCPWSPSLQQVPWVGVVFKKSKQRGNTSIQKLWQARSTCRLSQSPSSTHSLSMSHTKDFSSLQCANFTDPKKGRFFKRRDQWAAMQTCSCKTSLILRRVSSDCCGLLQRVLQLIAASLYLHIA